MSPQQSRTRTALAAVATALGVTIGLAPSDLHAQAGPPKPADRSEPTAKPESMQGKVDAVQGKHQARQGKVDAAQGKHQAVQGKHQAVQGKVDAAQGKHDAVQGKVAGKAPDTN